MDGRQGRLEPHRGRGMVGLEGRDLGMSMKPLRSGPRILCGARDSGRETGTPGEGPEEFPRMPKAKKQTVAKDQHAKVIAFATRPLHTPHLSNLLHTPNAADGSREFSSWHELLIAR